MTDVSAAMKSDAMEMHGHSPGVVLRSLVIGVVLALAYLALAAWFFLRVHRHAVRTGLIARYSAETVS